MCTGQPPLTGTPRGAARRHRAGRLRHKGARRAGQGNKGPGIRGYAGGHHLWDGRGLLTPGASTGSRRPRCPLLLPHLRMRRHALSPAAARRPQGFPASTTAGMGQPANREAQSACDVTSPEASPTEPAPSSAPPLAQDHRVRVRAELKKAGKGTRGSPGGTEGRVPRKGTGRRGQSDKGSIGTSERM